VDDRSEPALLAQSTAWLLVEAAREIAAEFEKVLKPADLRWRDYSVLGILEAEGPRSQQELGRRLAVDRSTMVHVIDVLEGRGLVSRSRDPADRRAYAIALTDEGRALLADLLHPATAAVDEQVTRGLPPADRLRLNRILVQLAAKPEVEHSSVKK
jgi:MarR family transcriptional regulator, lower aerobic nicotinate degradation pathway regulator